MHEDSLVEYAYITIKILFKTDDVKWGFCDSI